MCKPLQGKTIVVTRAVEQADEFLALLQQKGAHVINFPTIEIVPPDSWDACDQALQNLTDYDWIIFSSTNGVRFFLQRLKECGNGIEKLSASKIAAVGERTQAALQGYGITVDLVPHEFRAEGLLKAFREKGISGLRILVPRAEKGRETLIEGLTSMGALVDVVPVYKTQAVSNTDFNPAVLNGHFPDVLTFTSPSTVRHFIELIGLRKVTEWCVNGTDIAVIGDITADEVSKYKLHAHIMPEKSTIPHLVEAIAKFYD